jgi:hypothetical protein
MVYRTQFPGSKSGLSSSAGQQKEATKAFEKELKDALDKKNGNK